MAGSLRPLHLDLGSVSAVTAQGAKNGFRCLQLQKFYREAATYLHLHRYCVQWH
jgi:hypothetical protein